MKLTAKERRTLARLAPPELRKKLLSRKPGRPRLKVSWARARKLREQGWTYQRIAEELGVSVGSVYGHLKPSPSLR